MIADLSNSKKLYNELAKSGWKEVYRYTDNYFKTDVIILKK